MTHQEKIDWMIQWAHRNKVVLELEGECGFGRACVGILSNNLYPDYYWRNKDTWDHIDNNGEVWTPPDAYHKHACVAVLGRGEKAESQLYDWLKWFDDNGFTVEVNVREDLSKVDAVSLIFNGMYTVRMVRKQAE